MPPSSIYLPVCAPPLPHKLIIAMLPSSPLDSKIRVISSTSPKMFMNKLVPVEPRSTRPTHRKRSFVEAISHSCLHCLLHCQFCIAFYLCLAWGLLVSPTHKANVLSTLCIRWDVWDKLRLNKEGERIVHVNCVHHRWHQCFHHQGLHQAAFGEESHVDMPEIKTLKKEKTTNTLCLHSSGFTLLNFDSQLFCETEKKATKIHHPKKRKKLQPSFFSGESLPESLNHHWASLLLGSRFKISSLYGKWSISLAWPLAWRVTLVPGWWSKAYWRKFEQKMLVGSINEIWAGITSGFHGFWHRLRLIPIFRNARCQGVDVTLNTLRSTPKKVFKSPARGPHRVSEASLRATPALCPWSRRSWWSTPG